jgi:hypothetical protein
MVLTDSERDEAIRLVTAVMADTYAEAIAGCWLDELAAGRQMTPSQLAELAAELAETVPVQRAAGVIGLLLQGLPSRFYNTLQTPNQGESHD